MLLERDGQMIPAGGDCRESMPVRSGIRVQYEDRCCLDYHKKFAALRVAMHRRADDQWPWWRAPSRWPATLGWWPPWVMTSTSVHGQIADALGTIEATSTSAGRRDAMYAAQPPRGAAPGVRGGLAAKAGETPGAAFAADRDRRSGCLGR